MPLGANGKYVTLLQNFCPLCFRGRIGHSNGTRYTIDNPRINQEQLHHSKKFNGIPPLDFKCMGEVCEDGDACNVICLVCGKPVFSGGSGAYRLFKHMIQPDEVARGPKAIKAFDEIGNGIRFREALKANNAVLAETWDTPIHRECAYVAPCKCILPLDCTTCKKHRKREDFQWGKQTASYKADTGRAEGMEEEQGYDPVDHALPSGGSRGACGATGGMGSSWSSGSSKGAVFTSPLPLDKETLETSLPVLASIKQKPAQKKVVPLAPGFRTLDKWMAPPCPPPPAVLDATCPTFSLKEHSRAFDVSSHGYVAMKDGIYYRFPDGRTVKTYSGVSTITDVGALIPSGSDTVMRDS